MKLPPPAAPAAPELPVAPAAPLEVPVPSPARKSGSMGWVLGGGVVLVLAGVVTALFIIKNTAAIGVTDNPPPKPPITKTGSMKPAPPKAAPSNVRLPDGISAGEVQIEKAPTGNLKYAVGVIKNESTRQRFGVKVELDLFDNNNVKLGVVTDYQPVIEPQKEWRFRALLLDAKTVRANLSGLKEDQ